VSPVIGTPVLDRARPSAKQHALLYIRTGMTNNNAQLPHVIALLVAEKLAETNELNPDWCVARDAAALACAGLPAMAAILWDALEPPGVREKRWAVHTSRRAALTPTQGARVVDLKALCRSAGVKLTGLKADLQARLEEVVAAIPCPGSSCPLSPERRKQLCRKRTRTLRESRKRRDHQRALVWRPKYRQGVLESPAVFAHDIGALRHRQGTLDRQLSDGEAAVHSRRLELVMALNERGCRLRGDSRLCQAYIEEGVGDPHDIARQMQEMAFFHRHTRYGDFFRQIVETYRDNEEYWDRDEVSAQAKARALKDWAATEYPGGRQTARRAPELPPSLRRYV
jgi:hypothetical protein